MQDRYLRNVHSQWEEKIFCHGMFYIKKEKGWRLVFVSSVQKTFHCFDKYLDHVIYYATMTRINMIKNGGGANLGFKANRHNIYRDRFEHQVKGQEVCSLIPKIKLGNFTMKCSKEKIVCNISKDTDVQLLKTLSTVLIKNKKKLKNKKKKTIAF